MFNTVERKDFREIFQPSRVILAVVKDQENNRWNFFPVAFNMYCGYSPLTFCFAVHDINYSYKLLEVCTDFAISVPGENIVDATMESGLVSGESIDKFDKYKLTPLLNDEQTVCFGISECIANVYCKKIGFYKVSDHAIVVGQVERILRDYSNDQKNILSVSQKSDGYTILNHKGIHRLAVKK